MPGNACKMGVVQTCDGMGVCVALTDADSFRNTSSSTLIILLCSQDNPLE